jgi:hypothetical protein
VFLSLFAHSFLFYQVLLMSQLRHPNIVGAQDIYMPSDIPLERRDGSMRLQRSCNEFICVRMPYYPADMAWLIHSSPQILTPEHVQVCHYFYYSARDMLAKQRCFFKQMTLCLKFCVPFLWFTYKRYYSTFACKF